MKEFDPLKQELWITERLLRALAGKSRMAARVRIEKLYKNGNLYPETRGTATIINLEGDRVVKRKMHVYNLQALAAILRSWTKITGWREEIKQKIEIESLWIREQRYKNIECLREYKETMLLDCVDNKIIRLADTQIRKDKPKDELDFLKDYN